MLYNFHKRTLKQGGSLSRIYYTRRILKQIRSAINYHDLLSTAMIILRAMHHDHPFKPVTMVCGPISTGGKNSRKENLKVFSVAIDRMSADGMLVFSQMPFEDDMERIFNSSPNLQGLRLMEEFYLPILKSGFIKLMVFLPGWEKSIGATWEHEQSKALNIPRIYLAESYIAD
jgi:hypothetical protein